MTELITIQVAEVVEKEHLMKCREILERYLLKNGMNELYEFLPKGRNTLPNLMEVADILKKLRQYVYDDVVDRKETIQEVIDRLYKWDLDNKS